MYADDLVAFSPCSAGLQEILSICSQYGAQFDIKYNAEKSNIMIVRSREDRRAVFPMFFLSGKALVCAMRLNILVTTYLMIYQTIGIFNVNVANYMHKQTCLRGNSTCVPLMLKLHCLERTAHLYILLTCGSDIRPNPCRD